jgi:hypothetical protein
VVLKLLGLAAGAFGGGKAPGAFGNQGILNGGIGDGFDVGSFPGAFRAKGGPVDQGSPYIVGEEGPELFVPKVAGRVLSNADSVRAMSRYNTANSIQNSQAASEAEAAREGRSGGSTAMPTIRLETTVINGVEYATKEQVQEAATRASIEGAKMGEQRTLRRMQFSPSSRRRIGL